MNAILNRFRRILVLEMVVSQRTKDLNVTQFFLKTYFSLHSYLMDTRFCKPGHCEECEPLDVRESPWNIETA